MVWSEIIVVPEFFKIIILSILIGFLVGLERIDQRRKIVTIRFFILVSMTNAVTAFLSSSLNFHYLSIISMFATLVFAVLLVISRKWKGNYATGMAIIFMGILGLLLGYGYTTFALAGAVLLAIVLVSKEEFIKIGAFRTKRRYIIGALQLLVLAFILLPLLPNKPIDPWGLINLHSLLLIVILISGLQFVAFVLTKIYGGKGLFTLSGLVGFVDSNVINGAMVSITKKNPKFIDTASSAVVAGNLAMIIKNLIIVGIFSIFALKYLVLPSVAMLAVGGFFIYLSFKKGIGIKKSEFKVENPFEIKTALQFAIATIIITIIAYFAQIYFGTTGLFLTAVLGSLITDIGVIASAIMLVSGGSITMASMAIIVMINSFVSSLNDGILQFMSGDKKLAVSFFKKAIPIVAIGIIVLLAQFIFF